MSSSFKIATYAEGEAGLTALDELTTAVTPDPQFFFNLYAAREPLGDESYRGLGSSQAEWHFPQLTLAQRNQLAAYCTAASAQVYIATPDNEGTFTNFLASMRLPDEEPPIKGGLVEGYVIRFGGLVEQVTP